MGHEVEAHEEEEDGHGKACQYFCAFEAERVPDGGTFPDFEVAEYIHHNAYCCRYGIEENEMR